MSAQNRPHLLMVQIWTKGHILTFFNIVRQGIFQYFHKSLNYKFLSKTQGKMGLDEKKNQIYSGGWYLSVSTHDGDPNKNLWGIKTCIICSILFFSTKHLK